MSARVPRDALLRPIHLQPPLCAPAPAHVTGLRTPALRAAITPARVLSPRACNATAQTLSLIHI
eukprot:9992225-Lingulodinium_polyedra.AAC.1